MRESSLFDRVFVLLRLCVDVVQIPLVIILAYSLKFKVGWVFRYVFMIPYGNIYDHAQIEPYLHVMGVIVGLWVLTFYLVGLYRPSVGLFPGVDEIIKTIKGVTIATVQVIALSFFYREIPSSRAVLIYSWIIGILVVSASRLLILQIELLLIRKRKMGTNAIVIGENDAAQDITEKLVLCPTLRMKYCGSLADTTPLQLHYHLRDQFKVLGIPSQYQSICKIHNIGVIFLCSRAIAVSQYKEMVAYCDKHDITLKVLSEMSFLTPLTVSYELDGVPFLTTESGMGGFSRITKRIFDILVSALGLLLLLPLFLIIAIATKISSPDGPVLYWQERIGKNGVPFNMVKFRSMVVNAEEKTGPAVVDEKNETRYTSIGKWIRKWSLDELPQLWNVLIGDMSIVGPRPERGYFVDKFEQYIPYYGYRHKVKGGITGWAQVNGRSVLTRRPEQKIKYDLYYIKAGSLLLDFKILLKTVFVVLKREEAY